MQCRLQLVHAPNQTKRNADDNLEPKNLLRYRIKLGEVSEM
jgi:hypothetical protein